MYGTCRAGEVEYPVNFQKYRLGNIVADDLEMGVTGQVQYIFLGSRKEIVQADDVVSVM